MQNNYHGILLDEEFISGQSFISTNFNIFAQRKSKTNSWTLFGVEFPKSNLKNILKLTQENLLTGPYYLHFYNDTDLIVVFKEKIFTVEPHISTWQPIIDYGKTLGVPATQLDFWPNRFQDEQHYFNHSDYL